MKRVVISMTIMLLSFNVFPESLYLTGNELHQLLTNGSPAGKLYVMGAIDFATTYEFICLPEGGTSEKASKYVLDYMEIMPQLLGEPGRISVHGALHDLWPCPKNQIETLEENAQNPKTKNIEKQNKNPVFLTGSKLHEYLTNGNHDGNFYVMGVIDELMFQEVICPPYGETSEKASKYVLDYMGLYPAYLVEPARDFIFTTLHRLWPCPKSQTNTIENIPQNQINKFTSKTRQKNYSEINKNSVELAKKQLSICAINNAANYDDGISDALTIASAVSINCKQEIYNLSEAKIKADFGDKIDQYSSHYSLIQAAIKVYSKPETFLPFVLDYRKSKK